MDYFHARTVVQSASFSASMVSINETYKRADEVLRGIEWTLARNPRLGTQVADHTWTIPLLDIFSTAYEIVYTFDDSFVHLLAIRCTRIDEMDMPSY